jgi:hypothetical protein
VLVAALVALAIVMSLVATMLLAAVQARRQLRIERDARQCDLLLLAGIERAQLGLSKEPEYAGETWTLNGDAFADGRSGQVTIRQVNRPSDTGRAEQRQFEITAEYPLGDETSVRRSFTGGMSSRQSTSKEK